MIAWPEEAYVRERTTTRDEIMKTEVTIGGVPYTIYKRDAWGIEGPTGKQLDTGLASLYYLEPKSQPNYEACYTRSCQTRRTG